MIQEMIETIKSVIADKVKKHPIPSGNIEEKIFTILMSGSKEKHIIDSNSIYAAIKWAVKNDLPINLSLFWTTGAHARSSYKIIEWQKNIPRLGDVWGIFFFFLLNEKIKKIYPPGMNIYLIDEVQIVKLIGWKNDEILLRKRILSSLIPQNTSISIIDMPEFSLKKRRITVDPSQVLTVLTAQEHLGFDLQKNIAKELYVNANKDWVSIKNMVGNVAWEKATSIAEKISLCGVLRKETNWAENQIFNNNPFIDGCLLMKGRWCPKIWNSALPQHGGALLDTDNVGRFSIQIIPEHRLMERGATPYRAKIHDYSKFCSEIPKSLADDSFIFFWKE